MKKIGLFGGTFDPVHYGHLSIARSFLSSDEIEELWVMVTPRSPHKKDADQSPFELRFKMTKMAFLSEPKIQVRDDEHDLPVPSYTWQTLQHLRHHYPHIDFCLCIGEDQLDSFNSWYHYQEIIESTTILVAKRPGTYSRGLKLPMQNVHFIEHEPVKFSSTEIRSRVASGRSISDWVPETVENIIRHHKLYH